MALTYQRGNGVGSKRKKTAKLTVLKKQTPKKKGKALVGKENTMRWKFTGAPRAPVGYNGKNHDYQKILTTTGDEKRKFVGALKRRKQQIGR